MSDSPPRKRSNLSGVNFEDSGTYHDRVLIVGDKKFHVVSGILSMWSEYFRKMFDGNFTEANKKEIELKEVDPEVFEEFLKLVYGIKYGNDIKVEFLLPLIDFSFRFFAPKILESCEIYIGNSFSAHSRNAGIEVEVLRKACEYDIPHLKDNIIANLIEKKFINSLDCTRILDCAIEYKLANLQVFIGEYISRSVTIQNCAELLDYSITKELPSLKEGILKKLAIWHEDEKEMWSFRYGNLDRIPLIPEDNIIGLAKCAFKHNVAILKSMIQLRIFYMVRPAGHYYEKVRPDQDVDSCEITVNTFMEIHSAEILALPKEIAEFIMKSTISPY